MQPLFSSARIFGLTLLIAPMAAVEDCNFPGLVYFAGATEEKRDLETGFNLYSLNIEALADNDTFAKLIEQLLWIDADVLCLQRVRTDEIATALYSVLQHQYAHFYLDSQQRMVASRYKIDHPSFGSFAVDAEEISDGLFDFFQSPELVTQIAREQYFIDLSPFSAHETCPGTLASIIKKESCNVDSLSKMAGLDYWNDYSASLLCKADEISKEAQEHRDHAGKALREAFGHLGGIITTLDIPPVAALELYNSTQAMIEAAKEYNEYVKERYGRDRCYLEKDYPDRAGSYSGGTSDGYRSTDD